MPLQNRVTPWGEIVSTSQRGTMLGNRGIIHDPATRTLLTRRWSTNAWIACVCEWKGRRRVPMVTRSWTELFFLDEPTALAAGHRPCFYCRRNDAITFRAAWSAGNAPVKIRASEIDTALHRERLDGKRKRMHPLTVPMQQLPDGVMLADGADAYLVVTGGLLRWSFDGYSAMSPERDDLQMLTPPSIVRALAAGYRPRLHDSARR